VKELAALGRVSAREKLAAKRRAKQHAKLSAKQKEKNVETLVPVTTLLETGFFYQKF